MNLWTSVYLHILTECQNLLFYVFHPHTARIIIALTPDISTLRHSIHQANVISDLRSEIEP